MRSFLKNYKLSIPVALALVGVAAWLVFGVFAVQLLVVDDKVDQPVPAFDQPAGQPSTIATGMFASLDHETTGIAIVLGDGTEQRFLRFEDFETSNGPDLNVYLVNSSTGDVSDFIDLGNLHGNIGNQNYEVPPDVDLDVYDAVVVWCVRFSSPFGRAELVAA
jgi:Electron transfer DM13